MRVSHPSMSGVRSVVALIEDFLCPKCMSEMILMRDDESMSGCSIMGGG